MRGPFSLLKGYPGCFFAKMPVYGCMMGIVGPFPLLTSLQSSYFAFRIMASHRLLLFMIKQVHYSLMDENPNKT